MRRKMSKSVVKDATKPIALHITKSDVKGSKKMSPENCAAAVALRRELKCAEVKVFLTKTYIKQDKDGPWIRYSTPESLRREITSFDRTSFFDAGDYHVTPVSPSHRLGAHAGGPRSRKDKSKRVYHHFTRQVRERGGVPN